MNVSINMLENMNFKKTIKTLLIVAIPFIGFSLYTSIGKVSSGEKAPDFTLPDTSGKAVTLSQFKGKYVLIDFWASWCKDCRIENKNLVKVYKKFANKDLVVLSVSLDFNKANWKETIIKDELNWPNHVSDLKKWQSPVAKLYGVKSIPSVFLVDREGNIIAKDLMGNKLEEALLKIFPVK